MSNRSCRRREFHLPLKVTEYHLKKSLLETHLTFCKTTRVTENVTHLCAVLHAAHPFSPVASEQIFVESIPVILTSITHESLS